MSLAVDIADAVTALLNATTFSPAFTAVRRVLPAFELADLATLRVSVVPKDIELSTETRSATGYVARVDIGVQKRVSADVDADVASLCELVSEIAEYLNRRPLPTLPYAKWAGAEIAPLYAQDQLAESRVFTSVITVTYRAVKNA